MKWVIRICKALKLPWDCAFNRELDYIISEAERIIKGE